MGLLDRIVSTFGKGGNLLYYPGCLTRYKLPDILERYKRILSNLGVEFVMIDELHCCGSPAMNAGYFEDYENLKEYNLKKFKEYGITQVISNCPTCFGVFKSLYSTGGNDSSWKIDVLHMTQFLLKYSNKLKPVEEGVKITFHDPCHLGRYEGVYSPPRELLRTLGYELIEMVHTKEQSICCGAGGGVRSNYTEISQRIADYRIKEAKETGADWLITCCPMCYLQLKEAGERNGVEVRELSQVIKI